MRRTGKIPGVLYGNGREALPFAVESRHLREALSEAGGRHAVLEVKVPGAKTPVHAIIKDMQLHPLRDTLQHFDLLEVRMDRADPGHRLDRLHRARPRASRRSAASSRRTRTSSRSRRCRAICPSTSSSTSPRSASATRSSSSDLPARPGITYIGDPDTMLASVAEPKGPTAEEEAAEAEALEAAEAAEAREGGEAEAEGEGGGESADAE